MGENIFERSTTQPKAERGYVTTPRPETELVELPEIFNKQLLEGPDSPLAKALTFLQRYGFSAEQSEAYAAAVHRFMERPSVMGSSSDGTNFFPDTFFFRPIMFFYKNKRYNYLGAQPVTLPDVLAKTGFKPRLGAQAQKSDTSPKMNGKDWASRFDFVKPLNKYTNSTRVFDPQEKLLVQINRFMYALHEPLHIMQEISLGDQLEGIKHRHHAETIFNPEKERAFYAVPLKFDTVPLVVDPGASLKDHLLTAEDIYHVSPWDKVGQNWTVLQNEHVMDVLADHAVRDTLRSNKVFLLWLHNTFAATWSAYTWILKDIMDPEGGHEFNSDELEKYEYILSQLSRPYFAAFASTNEAAKFFGADGTGNVSFFDPQTSRTASARLVECEDISMFDVTNKIEEHLALENIDDSDELPMYKFPTGEKFFYKQNVLPVSRAGAALAAEIIHDIAVRVNEGKGNKKVTSRNVELLFHDIDEAAGAGKEYAKRLAGSVITRVAELAGRSISQKDIQSMFGIGEALFASSFSEDAMENMKLFMVRKVLIEKFLDADSGKQNSPEHAFLAPMVEATLFHSVINNRSIFQRIMGVFDDRKHHFQGDDVESAYTCSWQILKHSRSVGIIDLNIADAPPAEREKIKKIYAEAGFSQPDDNWGNIVDDDPKLYGTYIEQLVEIRKQQVEREQAAVRNALHVPLQNPARAA